MMPHGTMLAFSKAWTVMRITGGEARGRSITSPEGLAVRPTGAKIRQAFFNILGQRIEGARFLDVFAGTGMMGLEALSRGCNDVVFVEESRRMTDAIQSSLGELGYEAKVMTGDFRRLLPGFGPREFDIIFADPPYKSPFGKLVVEVIERHELLAEGGVLVVEHLRGNQLPVEINLLQKVDQRNYGQTGLSFFRKTQENC
jgi:16S rRNA (guanine966-N2)-methyltransferase